MPRAPRSRKQETNSLAERRRRFIFDEPQHFKEVARENMRGIDVTVEELDKIVSRIRSFPQGIDLGGGILLWGDVGTGKTHAALYIITQTKDSARAIDLRRFPRAIVDGREDDLSAEDIHEVCGLAGEYVKERQKPILLLYDNATVTEMNDKDSTEFDAMLEQLLIELSGPTGRTNGVYFIVTSSYGPNQFDSALLRPGRVGDQIGFDALTPKGQRELLRYAFKEYRPAGEKFAVELGSDANLDDIAELLEGHEHFSTPADILDGFRRAVVLAAQREQKQVRVIVGKEHLVNEAIRLITGQLAEEPMDAKSEEIAAYHEAGHVVFAHALGLPLRCASILPAFNSPSGGLTSLLPPKGFETEEQRQKYLLVVFGGKVAEKLFSHEGILSHRSDAAKMTESAMDWIKNLGGGEKFRERYGYLVDDADIHAPSETLKQIVEDDAASIMKRVEDDADALVGKMGENVMKERIRKIAAALLGKKILLRREIEKILAE